MYVTKWIEGEENLREFCLRRFKEKPRFVETIGHVGGDAATIHMIYKWREDKHRYTDMYLLFMRHEQGTVGDFGLSDIMHQSYEDIRTDRTAILRR